MIKHLFQPRFFPTMLAGSLTFYHRICDPILHRIATLFGRLAGWSLICSMSGTSPHAVPLLVWESLSLLLRFCACYLSHVKTSKMTVHFHRHFHSKLLVLQVDLHSARE